MRYHHTDFEPVRTYLSSGPADLRRLEWDLNPIVKDTFSIFALKPRTRPAAPPRPVGLEEIETALRHTGDPRQAARLLTEYFHVNAPPSTRAVSLAAAIEHVEAFGGPEEFLLAGHVDGGFISVSRMSLPFQEGLEQAVWWAPDTRWGT